jgi:benzoyl-CoA reductase/2-hydroxyglutaryl-CoA dehydratase subunit BcrC/BadD/HgdB
MSNMNLPIEVFDVFERKFGREDALVLGKALETTFSHFEERSVEIAVHRKIKAKEELKRELRDELATKEDIAHLRGEVKEDIAHLRGEVKEDIAHLRGEVKEDIASLRFDIAKLDKKFTVLFLASIFTTLFVNKDALTWFAQIIGLIR